MLAMKQVEFDISEDTRHVPTIAEITLGFAARSPQIFTASCL